MARQAPQRRLNEAFDQGDLTFAVAYCADEADIRRLLRDNPLGGRFELALEREPDAFAGDFDLAKSHVFIVARDRATGEAVGLCERVVRDAYVDGKPRPLAYIGALRVDPRYRHRISVLRGGFEALRRFAEKPGELPFALTSITSDNSVARRLLTSAAAGLPLYRPVGEFSTFALRPKRARIASRISGATEDDLPGIAAFLRKVGARFQYASVWTEADLRTLMNHGLLPEHFLIARSQGVIEGCLAVWDQRHAKQAVVHRYPPIVGRLRRLINLVAPLFAVPKLCPPGCAINQAILSHLAVEDDRPETFLALLSAGLDQARRRGFDVATIGMASSRGLRSALVGRHRAIEYRTSLYLVHPRRAPALLVERGGAVPHPELALL